MKIHEYQAKQLFKEFNIPVPNGGIASDRDEAVAAYKQAERMLRALFKK